MMTKREEKLAQELDAYLTAMLQERPLPPPTAVQSEAHLASALLDIAATATPDPDFLTHLEARLVRAAQSAPGRPAAPPPPAWQTMITTIKERFAMRNTILALGALVALLIIGYFAWSAWQNSAAPIVDTIAEVEAPIVVTTVVVSPEDESLVNDLLYSPTTVIVTPPPATAVPQPTLDPATAPPLPNLGNAGGLSMGLGGGGDATTDAPVETLPMPVDEMPIWDPLGDTTFDLVATLPTDPTALTVYAQPGQNILTVEDASRLAALFGLTGPVYTDTLPPDLPPDVVLSPVYFVFDGPRTLSVRTDGFYYFDQSAAPQFYAESATYEQAAPIAEAFLLERGLLDFPYEMHSAWGGSDVEFRRIVDGRPVNLAEYFVSVNADGQVMAVSGQPLTQLAPLGNYPLRTAEEAWQLLLADGVDYQTVSFITYPGPDWTPPEQEPYTDPYAGLYQSWFREYNDGDPITIYPYPTVHVAVDGQSPPRVQADQYLLLGSDDDLRAIAPYAYQQIRVSGIVRQLEGQMAIELADWEPVNPETFQFLPGLPGVIRRNGEQVEFVSNDGESFVLDQPPADIADGERVYLYGWRTVGPDGQPGFNWQNLDRIVEITPIAEEPIMEPGPFEPYTISQATIDRVDLIYVFTPVYSEEGQSSQFIIQPAWRFTGATNTREIIEIFVQAVPAEYVQPSN
jgi:hypothetical protein